MLQDFLENETFVRLMRVHVHEVLETLFQNGVNFSLLTNVRVVSFEPDLPEEITANFKPITMFVLAGYTFESASIDDKLLQFEAGFGVENIGSLVTVPLSSILQIVVEDTPVFINLSIPTKKDLAHYPKSGGVKKSMEALLSNPENESLLKK